MITNPEEQTEGIVEITPNMLWLLLAGKEVVIPVGEKKWKLKFEKMSFAELADLLVDARRFEQVEQKLARARMDWQDSH